MGELTPEEAEYVPTQRWSVLRFLEACALPGGDWFEPCVGDGDIVRAVDGFRSDVTWDANDIRAVRKRDYYRSLWCRDFTMPVGWVPRRWSVGATNPPFRKALPILMQVLQLCDHVAFLMPLAWPTGHERLDFLRDQPCDIYALPDRPWEFVRDVGWFKWPSDGAGYRILDKTPLDERKRDAAAATYGRYRGPEQLGLL